MISDHIPDRVIMKGIKRLDYKVETAIMEDTGLDQEPWLIQWQRELRQLLGPSSFTVRKANLARLDRCEGFVFLKDRVASIKRELARHDITIK